MAAATDKSSLHMQGSRGNIIHFFVSSPSYSLGTIDLATFRGLLGTRNGLIIFRLGKEAFFSSLGYLPRRCGVALHTHYTLHETWLPKLPLRQ